MLDIIVKEETRKYEITTSIEPDAIAEAFREMADLIDATDMIPSGSPFIYYDKLKGIVKLTFILQYQIDIPDNEQL